MLLVLDSRRTAAAADDDDGGGGGSGGCCVDVLAAFVAVYRTLAYTQTHTRNEFLMAAANVVVFGAALFVVSLIRFCNSSFSV